MEIIELKKDLAATFRWAARLNMNEGVANHFSACIPGSTDEFLVNKSGIHFSQMKVSDLILVNKENIEELKKKTRSSRCYSNKYSWDYSSKSTSCKVYISCPLKVCDCTFCSKRPCSSPNRSKYHEVL